MTKQLDVNGRKAKADATLITKAICYLFFACTLILPFTIQKARLDLTEGGRRSELSDFDETKLIIILFLHYISVAFLPVNRNAKFVLSLFLPPIVFVALFMFSLDYVCRFYSNCL